MLLDSTFGLGELERVCLGMELEEDRNSEGEGDFHSFPYVVITRLNVSINTSDRAKILER